MGPVWTAEEARAADQAAANAGLPFAALLAAAGLQLARAVRLRWSRGPWVVLTGPGSNGGDGWVAASHLARYGPVAVVPVAEPRFPDADAWVRHARHAGVEVLSGEEARTRIDGAAVVVDAMYGTGFHGSVLESPAGPWLDYLASRRVPVAAADILSGVNADTGAYFGPPVNVCITVAMEGAKWGHVGSPGADAGGELIVAAIGLPQVSPTGPAAEFIDPQWAYDHFPSPGPSAHKYTRGHVVIAGGSRGMPGAPLLAGLAALNAGAGLVEVIMPRSALSSGVSFSPALIVHGADEMPDGSLSWSPLVESRAVRADALVLGPGLGENPDSRLLEGFAKIGKPTVLDADGLRLARKAGIRLPANWAATPHAGELGALMGVDGAAINQDRRQAVRDAVERLGCSVLLKGRFSLIADGTHIWVNPTGNQALATAGSGDVLSGMAARLLAAGLSAADALALAAYWHGWTAEQVGNVHGVGFTAVDLAESLEVGAQAIWDLCPPAAVSWLP